MAQRRNTTRPVSSPAQTRRGAGSVHTTSRPLGGPTLADKINTGWQYARPIVYGSLIYLGVKEAFDGLDPQAEMMISPILQRFTNYGSYIADNATDLLSTGLGAYLGYRVGKHVAAESRTNLAKPTGKLAKLKSALGVGVIAPITLAAVVTSAPPLLTDVKNRYWGKDLETVLQETEPVEVVDQYKISKGDVQKRGKVTFSRIEKDSKALRALGYEISPQDLFYLTRVVAGEAGNYSKRDDFASRQKEDMNAITSVIINRYIASQEDPRFAQDFLGSDKSFASIVLKKGQFDIANSKRRKMWETGLAQEDLYFGLNWRSEHNKTTLAYLTILETMLEAKQHPGNDPTEGALFYKNTMASRQRWNNKDYREFKQKYVKRIQDHWYYVLQDKQGQVPMRDIRGEFFD